MNTPGEEGNLGEDFISEVPNIRAPNLKVFLSWSGESGKALALALNDWLPVMFHDLQVWMSERNIPPGSVAVLELARALSETNLGIICLTPESLENHDLPWVNFEAGALSRKLEDGRLIPYRLDLRWSQVTGPLSQFQSREANQQGTLDLVETVNRFYGARLSNERLAQSFQMLWPMLQLRIEAIPKSTAVTKIDRPQGEILEEILAIVRQSKPFALDPANSPLKVIAPLTPMNFSLSSADLYDNTGFCISLSKGTILKKSSESSYTCVFEADNKFLDAANRFWPQSNCKIKMNLFNAIFKVIIKSITSQATCIKIKCIIEPLDEQGRKWIESHKS